MPGLDDALGYSTKKVVVIRDKALGGIYYTLVLLVALWVIGGQIIWRNEQYLLKDVHGLPRMWYTHPTLDHCNPASSDCKSDYLSLEDLQYCDVYKGKTPSEMQAPCRYKDKLSMFPQGETDNKLFIPTAIEIVTEKRSCKPGPENGHTCDNEYEEYAGSDCTLGTSMCGTRTFMPTEEQSALGMSPVRLMNQFYYVADVRHYKIQFTSSYEEGNVRGTSLDHPAYYQECPENNRTANKTKHMWTDRLKADVNDCADGKIVPLPCMPGVNCSMRRKFDMIADTGIGELDRNVRSRVPGVPGMPGMSMAQLGSEAYRADRAGLAEADASAGHLGFGDQSPWQFGADSQPTNSDVSHVNVGDYVTVLEAFESSSMTRMELYKNMTGLVKKKDGNGDALIDFVGVGKTQWVTKSNFAKLGPGDNREPMPDQYTNFWGDVFNVQRLFELAGADLDMDYNFEGWTTRQAGTVLEVRAVYSNLERFYSAFGYKQVKYHYEVKELPMPYVSRTELAADQPKDYPETRRYERRHGVLIWFKVGGEFGVFNIVYLLLMLVTGFALVGSASAATDMIAIYIHPKKRDYFHMKYEISPDFSTMWECNKCGYFNSFKDETCGGIGLWECATEAKPCGHKRPADAEGMAAAEARGRRGGMQV